MNVERRRRSEPARVGENFTAIHVVLRYADEVGGDAGAGLSSIHLVAVRLESAYASALTSDGQLDILTSLQVTVDQGAGYHCAESRESECSIYRQPWPCEVALRGDVIDHGRDGCYQLRQSLASVRRNGHDSRTLQGRAFERVLYVGHYQLNPIVIDQVFLRECHQSAWYLKEIEDRQVFACLRHDRLVGSHYQQGDVDSAYACEHVVHEALVAGDVDNADFVAGRQLEPRESEVYRQTPLLLLGETVRVDTREGLDESRLTVIDVSCCANDKHYEPRILDVEL